jgi:hypothetical protein
MSFQERNSEGLVIILVIKAKKDFGMVTVILNKEEVINADLKGFFHH